MRIALIDNGLTIGGTLTMTANLSRGLRRRGHEVAAVIAVPKHLATPYFEGTAELFELKIPYNYLRSAALKRAFNQVPIITPVTRRIGLLLDEVLRPVNGLYGRQLAKLLARIRPDVIHMANGSIALDEISKLNIPIVFHLHGLLRTDMKPSEVVSLAKANRFIAISQCVADAYAAIGLEPSKVSTVSNFVLPRTQPLPTREVSKQRLSIPNDGELIGFVGRLVPWKGVREFIMAMQRVAERKPHARFLIVGDPSEAPDYVSACRELLRSANLESRFHFIDHLVDPYIAYCAASVFVHASIEAEPFGMVVVEAMQAGTPVVAADLGGPQEIIENGVSGLLVDPKNAEQLASACLRLLDDASLRNSVIEAAKDRVRTQFSVDRAIDEIERIYSLELATAQQARIA